MKLLCNKTNASLALLAMAATGCGGGGTEDDPKKVGTSIGWSIVENSMTSDQCYLLAPGPDGLHYIEVDLDTEDAKIAQTFKLPGEGSSFHTNGFVVRENELAMRGYGGSGFDVLRIDRATGDFEWIPANTDQYPLADTFAGDANGFYDACGEFPGQFCRYNTLEDLAARTNFEIMFTGSSVWATRFTTNGDDLFGAWHSTDTIQRINRDTGAVTDIKVEGFDGWVDGMSVSGSSLYLASNRQSEENPWDRVIYRFDLASGALTGKATIEQNGIFEVALPGGLHCIEAPRETK